ncbi:MAG: hypothetical protein AAGF12_14905 [Myxococcota bacterium]
MRASSSVPLACCDLLTAIAGPPSPDRHRRTAIAIGPEVVDYLR